MKGSLEVWTGMNKVYKTIPYPGLLVSFGSFQRDWKIWEMKAENEHDDDKNTSEMGENKIALITENESLEYGRL